MDFSDGTRGRLVRILYFSDNASDHNRRFLEKISSSGHEVWFLNITGDSSPEGWLPARVRQLRPERVFRPGADPNYYEAFLADFHSLLQRLKPDLLQAGPVQSCGYVAALSSFHPMLLMAWGSDMLCDANRNEEWKRATEAALRGCDGFFCDCDAVRAAASDFVAIPSSRVVQFPWGIRHGEFSPVGALPPRDQLAHNTGHITFICTRSWEPLYAVDVLLEAFNRVYRRDNRLRLLLLGTGSEDNRIRDFIAAQGLNEVVLTPGALPREQLPNWFRAADAYVSCAKSDGTSVSLLEAMATGLPVVVTDLPSNREWVKEDENGWLATAGSVERFADRLVQVANLSPVKREAISRRNQETVLLRADWDRNFLALLNMYEHLASEIVSRQ